MRLLYCSVLLPGILNPRVLRIPCLAMVSTLEAEDGWFFFSSAGSVCWRQGVSWRHGWDANSPGMAGMWPLTILWRVVSHCFFHLSCSGGRFSSRSMLLLHPVSLDLCTLLVTRAACLMYGSNTVVPYSSKDLIQGMYAK